MRDYGLEAQQAAEAHLAAIWEYELADEGHPDVPIPDFAAPFCGCDTCIVREVLHAAWPIIMEAARD